LRVLVVFNQPRLDPSDPDYAAESEVVETAAHVARVLERRGHQPELLAIGPSLEPLLITLERSPPPVVFNLFEGTALYGLTEATVASLLEWYAIPYTGCPLSAIVWARDKARCKDLLRGVGLPTPDGIVVAPDDAWPCECVRQLVEQGPVIVKLAGEEASVGLDQSSVTADVEGALRRVRALQVRYRMAVLVERFIPGREFNIAVIERPQRQVLPPSEIVFTPPYPGWWPMVTYASKWQPGSVEDLAARPQCPARLDPSLHDLLCDLAERAFVAVGCRDYARVDMRLDPAGKPFILEVNANPDVHPEAGLARSLRAAGIDYDQFIEELVVGARQRHERRHVVSGVRSVPTP